MNDSQPQPHDTWAAYYDFVNEQTFAGVYQPFTEITLELIRRLHPPGSLVDFGAGTGRLSIPLAKAGYAVTAVEQCRGMLDCLFRKAQSAQAQVRAHHGAIQAFETEQSFDVAICVFTTITYIVDDSTLTQALGNMARSLRKGGKLLIDIPQRRAFVGLRRNTPTLQRELQIARESDDVYTFADKTRCHIDGVWQEYEDLFRIRYWPSELILGLLKEHGVECGQSLLNFSHSGADYYVGTKVS